MVTLSAVVPATDRPVTLERCLDAIARADVAPDEVVVVEHPSELSAAGARNEGVRRATGDVIVFVDADVEVHRDAFVGIRAAYAADPALAAVYGSYDDSPRAPTTVSAFRNLLHHHVHQAGAGPADTFWTGLGAVRRTAFLDIGGFDEARYPHPSVEDIEFGRRLSDAGQPILLDPTIQGTHLKAWTLRSMIWTDFARRGIPWVALECRQRRLSSSLNLGWRHRLSAAACVIGVARGAAPPVRHRAGRARGPRRAEPLVLRSAAPPARPRACVRRCRPPCDAPPRRRRRGPGGSGGRSGRARDRSVVASTRARAGRERRGDARRMTSHPVRIGLVGCGRLAELGYIPALARVQGAELVAVADPDPIRRDRAASIAAAAR